jgi:predicted nucleotidyltransferase component of viral defense system
MRRETPVPGFEALDTIRTAVISALFSVDVFYDRLVLKGGNALRLVYAIQDRSSLDLDFSLDGDFDNFEEAREALISALKDRLDSAGYHCFDESLEPRPRRGSGEWGGYQLEFKAISKDKFRSLGGNLDRIRREALTLDAAQSRIWTVQISKFEHCDGKARHELDSQTIFVYTPEMIVIEKLRALCQQMPEYSHRRHQPAPRARDFYDIHEILKRLISVEDLQTPEAAGMARAIFAAKEVPLSLLSNLASTRDFHAIDWPSVEQSIIGDRYSFEHYFGYVVTLVREELERFWVV